ncbi:unnamed protein product, partial [marine sediment metagenome]
DLQPGTDRESPPLSVYAQAVGGPPPPFILF